MLKFIIGFIIALILAGNSQVEEFFTFTNLSTAGKQVVKFTTDTTKSIIDSGKQVKND